MTRPPTDEDDDRAADTAGAASTDEVLDAMDQLEPYTTAELAGVLDLPDRLVRRLLEALADGGDVRRKRSGPGTVLCIREPPARTCPGCGRAFEVKYLHAVLTSVKYCPRCGTRL